MRIAFDLDNTLIRNNFGFPLASAKHPLLQKLLGTEELRLGVHELFAYCHQQGWEVWIYTTSYRSPFYIRKMLWVHGLRVNGIVNQAHHNQQVRVQSTKHPPTFSIDALVDDSKGIELEGQQFGFHVVQIEPTDAAWVLTVQTQLQRLASAS